MESIALTPGQEMARSLAWSLDPAKWAREALQFRPDPWQEEFLRCNSRQVILVCSRQSGKSTITAVLACHTAIFQPGALVLLVSKAARQSQELFQKCSTFLKSLPNPPDLPTDNLLSCRLANGSRIVSLPGDSSSTIRGYSAPALLVEDEAAFVSDDLYQAMRPMLATSPRSRIVLMSSPHGRAGHFYMAAVYEEGWHKFKVTADECPRISKEWLAQERAQVGEWWYLQEFMAVFLDGADDFFSSEAIEAAVTDELKPLALRFG
jgi:hypothetical protein